jgi:TolB-like protein
MRSFILAVASLTLLSWPLAAFDSEITDTARKLAVEYRKANPDVIFKQALVILPLQVKDAGLQDKNIGPAVKAVLQRELVKSLIFEVTEREELQKILAEAELQQTGLTSGGKPVDFSQLRSADLLLAGEVISQNGDLRVELRLISARSGKILAAAGTNLPRNEAESAGKQYYAQAFQSRYGLNIAGETGFVSPKARGNAYPMLNSFTIAYRAFPFLRLGLGYSLFDSDEFQQDNIPASYSTGGSNIGYRKYQVNMHGPKLAADFILPIAARFNLLLRTEGILFVSSRLMQEVVELPVYIATGTGTNTLEQQRVLVEGFGKEQQAMLRVGLGGEFLISQRISLILVGGYIFGTTFSPTVFEASGYRQWTDDADKNGTFRAYGNFNFARRADGTPVSFNFSGAYATFGIGLHF